jgi:hypothetical protein
LKGPIKQGNGLWVRERVKDQQEEVDVKEEGKEKSSKKEE